MLKGLIAPSAKCTAGAFAVFLQAKRNYLGHRDSSSFVNPRALADIRAQFVPCERRPEINASFERLSTSPGQHLVPLRTRVLKLSPH